MWNLLTANALSIVTGCWGPSSLSRPGSLAGEPIVKLPAGTTTISGHLSHSLNTFFGLSAHSSAADSGSGARVDQETLIGAVPHGPAGTDGTSGGMTMATLLSSSSRARARAA